MIESAIEIGHTNCNYVLLKNDLEEHTMYDILYAI